MAQWTMILAGGLLLLVLAALGALCWFLTHPLD